MGTKMKCELEYEISAGLWVGVKILLYICKTWIKASLLHDPDDFSSYCWRYILSILKQLHALPKCNQLYPYTSITNIRLKYWRSQWETQLSQVHFLHRFFNGLMCYTVYMESCDKKGFHKFHECWPRRSCMYNHNLSTFLISSKYKNNGSEWEPSTICGFFFKVLFLQELQCAMPLKF